MGKAMISAGSGAGSYKLIQAQLKTDNWEFQIDDTVYSAYQGKWKRRRVGAITCNSSSALTSLRNATTNAIDYPLDSALSNSDIGIGDNFSIEQSTWLYFPEATAMSLTCGSDDEGCSFLNDGYIGTWASCSTGTFTYNFKKGWNLLTICWHEASGAAYGYCTTKFNTLIGTTILYQSAEFPGHYYQIVTPVGGKVKDTTSLFEVRTSAGDSVINQINEKGNLVCYNNNTIRISLPETMTTPPIEDITGQWIAI